MFLSFMNGFTGLGSHSQHGEMTERKAFGSVSDHRPTSNMSIFEGINVESKGVGFFTHMDNNALSASTHNVATMPATVYPVFPSCPCQPVSQTSLRVDSTPLFRTAHCRLISMSLRTRLI